MKSHSSEALIICRNNSLVRVIILLTLLALSTRRSVAEDSWSVAEEASAICGDLSFRELETNLATLLAKGRPKEADGVISRALSEGKGTCVGLALANLAAAAQVSRRSRDAEQLAERSIKTLEMYSSQNAPILLRPLQVLSAASLDSGHVAKSRKAFARMLQFAIESPEDRALVHMAAARLLDHQQRYKEAEVDIVAAIDAIEEAEGIAQADGAALLTSLALIRIKLRHYDDARATIKRAFAILEFAKDAGPIDRAETLHAQAILNAQTREWQAAAEDLRNALASIQGANGIDPAFIRTLLLRYAQALRHIHRREEARIAESRAATLVGAGDANALVDVNDLYPQRKRR